MPHGFLVARIVIVFDFNIVILSWDLFYLRWQFDAKMCHFSL
jgi:hypothetical protein